MNVLLADDNKFTREIFCNIFQKNGHSVETSTNGIECISKYKTRWLENKSRYFDVVILDYSMPGKNGDAVVKEILQIDKKQKIIVVSAWDIEKLKYAFKNLKDSVEIIQKGFPIEALVKKIEENEVK